MEDGGELVDWRGRPVQEGHKKVGGWRGSFFMLGAASCGYFAFGGIYFNLVLYLLRVWQESPATAANDLTNLLGTMFFTALLGAFLGDAYLGRLWTTVLFLVIYVVGTVLVGVSVTLQEHADMSKPLPSSLKAFLFLALYITAVGNGSYEPVLASLGGDQFDSPREKAIFFNWFFVFCNIGQLLSLTFLTYFENNGQWALGYWIAAGAVMVSLPVLLAGAPMCRQYKPGGNPFLRVVQVFVCAGLKFPVRVSPDVKRLYEVEEGQPCAIPGCRKLSHTNGFRWLDKASVMTTADEEEEGPGRRSAWEVCTVTQVEEVKCLIRILPFLIAGVLFNTIIAQLTTLFIEQGATMDARMGGTRFKIPPGSMQVFTVLSAILFAPAYDYLLVPPLRRRTGHPKGLTTLQRMGWGLFISILAMVVAALVERKRLAAARSSPLVDVALAPVPLSIYWLVPQYVIVGVGQVFAIVGQMDFFYSELSDGMRSVGISLPLVCRGLGNYASTLLVTLVTRFSTSRGRLGWIPPNLNRGHIDYFYWLLASLMAFTLAFYLLAAHFYTYLQVAPSSSSILHHDGKAHEEEKGGGGGEAQRHHFELNGLTKTL